MDQETGNGFSVRRTRKKSSYLVSALIFVYPAHVQRALPGASFFIGCRLQGSAFSATDRANFRRTSRIWARVPQTIRSSNQNLKMVRLRCMFTLYIFVCKTAGRTYIFSVAFFFTRIGNYLQARVRVKFPHGEQWTPWPFTCVFATNFWINIFCALPGQELDFQARGARNQVCLEHRLDCILFSCRSKIMFNRCCDVLFVHAILWY